MSEVKIDVLTRGTEEKNSELRKEGIIPAVLYGYKVPNQNFKLKRNEFEKVYNKVGESGLIELNIDGKSQSHVVVKEVQKDYVKNIFLHVDFYQVDMKKTIEVELPLTFIGESEVVKNKGGILATNLNSITVKCLPGDLIEMIEVDLSTLKTFDDKIKISDLALPASVEVISQGSALIANVLEPKLTKAVNADGSEKPEEDDASDKAGEEGERKEKTTEEASK